MMSPQNVSLNGESIIENGAIVYANGTPKVSPDNGVIAEAGATLRVDGADVTVANSAANMFAVVNGRAGHNTHTCPYSYN